GCARRRGSPRVRRGAVAPDARGRLLRHRSAHRPGAGVVNWPAIRAVVMKDLTAVRRSKAVLYPMLLVPTLLLVVLPLGLTLAARSRPDTNVEGFLATFPGALRHALEGVPPHERLIMFVDGYVLAPMFLIVPLMVSAVLAADAF